MDTIRWGIIGCGDVTELKSGPPLYKCGGSELVAVMRRNGDLAADYARRHGVPRWYDDADALIADGEVNAVYIATPPDSHCEYTLRVAAAGKPVYVEKPMALTHAQCRQMNEACAAARAPLFVAYYRRCLPAFVKVAELLQAGAVGEVRFATIQQYGPPSADDLDLNRQPWRVLPEIAGDGYFFDLGCHQLDLLDFLVGPVATASGITGNQAGHYPSDDIVSASFRFESGALGAGLWCFTTHAGAARDRTEIVGSEGSISYSAFALDEPVVLTTDSGREEFHLPQPEHVQQPLIQSIVDALRGEGECPSTGETGARTNRVLDQIVAAPRPG
jgi:predicted dehydrogenase